MDEGISNNDNDIMNEKVDEKEVEQETDNLEKEKEENDQINIKERNSKEEEDKLEEENVNLPKENENVEENEQRNKEEENVNLPKENENVEENEQGNKEEENVNLPKENENVEENVNKTEEQLKEKEDNYNDNNNDNDNGNIVDPSNNKENDNKKIEVKEEANFEEVEVKVENIKKEIEVEPVEEETKIPNFPENKQNELIPENEFDSIVQPRNEFSSKIADLNNLDENNSLNKRPIERKIKMMIGGSEIEQKEKSTPLYIPKKYSQPPVVRSYATERLSGLKVEEYVVLPANHKKEKYSLFVNKNQNTHTSSPFKEKMTHFEGFSNIRTEKNIENPPMGRKSPFKFNTSHNTLLNKFPEDSDYFFQMFRNVSGKNKHLKLLTDKVCKVSNKSPDSINESPNYVYNNNPSIKTDILYHSTIKSKSNDIMKMVEDINIGTINQRGTINTLNNSSPFNKNSSSYPNSRTNNFMSNNIKENQIQRIKPKGNGLYPNYDLTNAKDKELYVENLKKDLQEFTMKKSESRKHRDDYFAKLDGKIDNMYKKKQNDVEEKKENLEQDKENENKEKISIEAEKKGNSNEEKEEGKNIPIDEYEKLKKKSVSSIKNHPEEGVEKDNNTNNEPKVEEISN